MIGIEAPRTRHLETFDPQYISFAYAYPAVKLRILRERDSLISQMIQLISPIRLFIPFHFCCGCPGPNFES